MLFVVFLALLSTATAQCQCNNQQVAVVPGQGVQISSPGFPNNYPAGCNCQYNFTVPMDYVLGFSFPFFFLGSTDTLRINSFGPNPSSQACYGVSCHNFNSSSTSAGVTFISVNPGPGFQMMVQAIQLKKCNCGPMNQMINPKTGSVALMSPGFGTPQAFLGNCQCMWTVSSPPHYKLNFTFMTQKSFAKMCFYNGTGPIVTNQIQCCVGPYCQQNVLTLSNQMTITYNSNFQSNGGFSAMVQGSMSQACDANPCPGRSTCQNTNTAPYFNCICPPTLTGVTCQLPACLLTVSNQGFYVLRATYSSKNGVSSVNLARGQQTFFTAVADTFITLHAYYGSTARLIVQQCTKTSIVCTGTTIVNFGCNYVPAVGPAVPIPFEWDPVVKEEKLIE